MQAKGVKVKPIIKVTVSEADRGEVKVLHNDPMVFIKKIANLKVGRIIIDMAARAISSAWPN